ncbi:hypothetical protein KIW84_014172 [Lathyrus oleraceus]|uniref:Protein TRIGALACTOSYLDIACYLGLYCEROL 4, chloroplastic n=1 Tax=Pisum sativum TaxID=3888 RepID=A0A9D5BMH1_PEA|nr:hypothetical protein KIW84_014172 [Pisum sativum]
MRKLRWVMDGGGFWDLDISTPKTIDGLASPVPGNPLPLGLSRGARLSRPRQLQFMQLFMKAPLLPTFSQPQGFSLQRVLSLPFSDNWVVFLLGQFNLQKFISSVQNSKEKPARVSSWLKTFGSHLKKKSLYALGLCSEFQLTPDDTLLFGLDSYDYTDKPRGKAVLHHKISMALVFDEELIPFVLPCTFHISQDTTGCAYCEFLCLFGNKVCIPNPKITMLFSLLTHLPNGAPYLIRWLVFDCCGSGLYFVVNSVNQTASSLLLFVSHLATILFPHHDLTVEAVYPGLFVDKIGNYWDVPFSMAIDLASSTTSDSSVGYHLSAHYTSGSPKQFESIQNQNDRVPQTLLPGLAFKSVFSCRKNIDIWRSETPKLKWVQPYDIFLSDPRVSASGMIGAAATTYFGENSARAQTDDDGEHSVGLFLQASGIKSSFLADLFGSISFTAQHGNFQRPFLDLSRFQARLDFPSGSKFLSGATSLTQDLLNSQKPNMEAVQAVCPNATVSLQQQIVGPISFRVDSGIAVDLKNLEFPIQAHEPVFAVEYALHVLGSAKAVAWCCPKRQEFMVELRFYET